MKIITMLKKTALSISVFCMSLYTKVVSAWNLSEVNVDGPGAEFLVTMYGIPKPETPPIWKITRGIIIPIIFISGVVIYLKKSKSSKLRKFITLLIALIIIILLCIKINSLINQFL